METKRKARVGRGAWVALSVKPLTPGVGSSGAIQHMKGLHAQGESA